MGLMGLLFQVAVECFDVLAWPLFALGYPICASIQAIETNSVADTQKLNTYWVCFSFILLFEHASANLLEWLPSWPFTKLIIVCCLVIPHFNGSFYVYNHFVHPCLYLTPRIVHNWFIKLKESLAQDKLLVEAKRETEETRPDASENLIAFGSFTTFKPMLEEAKVEKNNISTATSIVGKKEVTSTKQVRQTTPDFALPENRACEPVHIKEIVGVTRENKETGIATMEGKRQSDDASGNVKAKEHSLRSGVSPGSGETSTPHDSGSGLVDKPHSNVSQMEWNCPVCKLKTKGRNRKMDLASHFLGKLHEDALEKLKLKIEASRSKISPAPAVVETCSPSENKEMATSQAVINLPEKPSTSNVQIPWTCCICRVTIKDETSVVSHLQGRRHKDNCEKLKAHVQTMKQDGMQWWCNICNISCKSEGDMGHHLNGSKHLARTVELSGVQASLS